MESAERKMAKVYSFPLRPKAQTPAVRMSRMEAEARLRAKANVAFGNSWYHDEAIKEASER